MFSARPSKEARHMLELLDPKDIDPIAYDSSLQEAVHMLAKDVAKPKILVLDVGAWGGASKEWACIGKFVEIIGFEPDSAECQRLNSVPSNYVSSEKYYPYAISGKTGPREFYVTKSPTCSSLLKPVEKEWKRYGVPGSSRHSRAEVVKTLVLDTITLDDFCGRENIIPDFVKLDTQGSEMEILQQGFSNHLHRVIGLEIEVEFVPLYEGQPLFSEIEIFLRENRFDLYGLKRHRWKLNDGTECTKETGGRSVFGDALFLNRKLFNFGAGSTEAVSAILICKRYGLNDVADSLVAACGFTPPYIKSIMLEANKLPKQSLKGFFRAFRHRHPDRGTIVEFDDTYGF
jgi:FkbM family methyltransferase